MLGGSEKKVNENAYDVSSLKTFLEFSRCSRAKTRQINVQKKCAARAKFFFLLIRAIVVFHRSLALPSPLSITRFYILFEQTINVIESFAFCSGSLSLFSGARGVMGWDRVFLSFPFPSPPALAARVTRRRLGTSQGVFCLDH